MSGSGIKKIRQYYRRDIRSKMGLEVELAKRLIRPKGKWTPRWVWILAARITLNQELLDKWFNKSE